MCRLNHPTIKESDWQSPCFLQLEQWLAASNHQLVIVVFYAPWAGSYGLLDAFLQLLLIKHPSIQVERVNIEECPELAAEMSVTDIPTTLLFKDEEIVDVFVGIISRKNLAAKILPYV